MVVSMCGGGGLVFPDENVSIFVSSLLLLLSWNRPRFRGAIPCTSYLGIQVVAESDTLNRGWLVVWHFVGCALP